MFGEKRVKLITIQCACCGKRHVVRVDPEDLERHDKAGIYVQRAFADRDGKRTVGRRLRIPLRNRDKISGTVHSLLFHQSKIQFLGDAGMPS
jgi:hypothetical protein